MSKVELVLDAKAGVGECPTWHQGERALYWVDIAPGRLHRFDPATGKDTFWTLPSPIGCFAFRRRGGFIVGLKTGFHLYDPETGKLDLIAAPEADMPENRLNDGRADPFGRFWAGTMKDPIEPMRQGGTFYRVDTDLKVTPMVSGFTTCNASAFSPDGKTIYLGDSYPSSRTVWAWDYDGATGSISNRRVFCDSAPLRGRPDGANVDADGCYWFAAGDGWCLYRLTPKGKVDRIIDLPVQKPAMLAFGGSDLDTIFVTSIRIPTMDFTKQPHAGGVFAVRAGVKGLPACDFAG